MSWSSRKKKEGIFCTVYFVYRLYRNSLCFITMYIVLNTLSEYTYFYISKNITSYTFLLVFKIVESLQCILKDTIASFTQCILILLLPFMSTCFHAKHVSMKFDALSVKSFRKKLKPCYEENMIFIPRKCNALTLQLNGAGRFALTEPPQKEKRQFLKHLLRKN